MVSKNLRIFLFVGFSVFTISMIVYFYQVFYTPNVQVGKQAAVIRIPNDATIDNVSDTLMKYDILSELVPFRFVSKALKYNENVKPGLYVLEPDMTNIEAVRYLRSGAQTPIKITFNNARTLDDVAERFTQRLEITPDELLDAMYDEELKAELGLDSLTMKVIFLPNTYEVYWTISAKSLVKRMKKEYDKFWDDARKKKAEAVGLTPFQVSVLASIVESETIKADEMPKVAGLYINRLNKGWGLQSDPTVVFAAVETGMVNDFTDVKRVLNKHLAINSPYNTYKHTGLPPGPIRIPSTQAINAVLNATKHKYMYMVAEADFSGYHHFSKTLKEHNYYARKYQNALNKARVYK
ncbi:MULTISPECIES: endolytic transglycosylase MltG [Flammeovirga]|uniref:Endolytic murein transglycosylase n=1 Tax=Flammeovirga agarivorans TaxID=2726742 RepID=A0A7X8SJA2_9BACT|nr:MULTISPECIES: endolytic transglycosylase MltG [Flammeovirga]NLR91284.1 endolytic transglycosylase MltG [Flammeovirga agarivorans]